MPKPAYQFPPELKDLEACPSCGSNRIACVLHSDLDFCVACHKCWERLRAGDAYTVDGEPMAFHTPCDNCAFRGGSEERKDREGWEDLQHSLSVGGAFYCHKGVPFSVIHPDSNALVDAGDRAFEFPKRPARIDLAGACKPYQTYDTARMRLCRGYLNAHIGPLLKG